ncbi:YbaB/EbfC family nucleoid-associated protein [Mycobacterium sp. Aquia_216]|uniref:YbaB/EbfC family nucleoid-associated protein n=1 Tax=Mycobacterium sp. Aquia_216 TaxID=2991729 RepID=UPI00227B1804|nr:YbaB/EbfC family nucleoid-associated protein [Mycobacterium sp. Aquia_216]WAJ45421.1 YbaB/EbfC family nucleoid-associated protein [Mycobacterium sp. Aquia_216]
MANHQPEQPQIADEHPGGALLRQADRLQSALDDYRYQETTFFSGSDETKTVSVTVDGSKKLADVYIEAGLLRLGSETVEQRLNEALRNANAAATSALATEREKLLETLGLNAEVIERLDSVIKDLQSGLVQSD